MNYKRQLKFECSVASCVSFFLWIHLYHPLANDSFCVWMQLPAVTHVHFFRNAYKMTSRRCVSARVDFAKKHMSTTYAARWNFFIWIPGLPGNWIITFYFINLVNDKVVTTKAKNYLRFLRLRIRLWVLATKIDESDKWIGSVKKAFLNVQNCQFCVVTHNHWLNWKTFWNLIHSEFFVTVLYNKTGL